MMTETIRIAGAQIPIHDEDIEFNKNEIFKALDWAKENDVDLIQTPEGSLSGYGPAWEDQIPKLQKALDEVEEYQKISGVALNLGTSFLNLENCGAIKRNQIRHYDKEGLLYAMTNKTYTVHGDGNSVPSFHPVQSFNMPFVKLHGVGMICNDMWGAVQEQGTDYKPIKALNEILTEKHVDIIFHSTHGYKFAEQDFKMNPLYNSEPYVLGDKDYIVRNTFDKWSEAWLQMTAFRSVATILTVDACVYWGWDGNENTIDKCRTSSPSGVVNPLGEWVAEAPRYGRQYFHYDLDLNTKQEYWKIINDKTGGTWKNEDTLKITK
tara:strand:+ start:460 stop:1425 length:966 start_codon:yes stop_codon:yes gene_type:complete